MHIITNCSKLKSESFELLCERTLKKEVRVEKTCRLGLEITLKLHKAHGSITIYLRKKRTSSLSILMMDNESNKIDSWTNWHNADTNIENWKKGLIYEFDGSVVNYIKAGMSNKNRDLKKLVQANLSNPNFHANIRCDGFTCIV